MLHLIAAIVIAYFLIEFLRNRSPGCGCLIVVVLLLALAIAGGHGK